MNITKEQESDLVAVIKIAVQPEDYRPKVEEVMKKYQRSANIPGFRPGKVPAGMIKKMYGKSVLVEELNKLLQESLYRYIYDNKIETLGSPIPKRTEKEVIFEDGQSFEFEYETGLAPKVEVNVNSIGTLPYYLVKVDDKMVEDDLNDMRRRYGKFSNPEVAEERHILYGDFVELDETGNVKEGGVKTTTTMTLELIKDEELRKPFVGVKKDAEVIFNPMKTLANETEVAAMLKVQKDSPSLNADYKFTVRTINQVEKADLNQEFFDKIYGAGTVADEEAFRAKIREGIASYFERESDKKMRKDLRLELMEKISIPLPDDFLKRMVHATAEKKIDEHEFEHQYYHIAEDLRWDLIRNRVATDNSIAVTDEEIKQAARAMVRQQFMQYGYYEMNDDGIEKATQRYLDDRDAPQRIERAILDDKVFAILKSQVKLNMMELPYEEFIAKLNEKTEHEMEHHH